MCVSKVHRPASRVAAHSRARQSLAWEGEVHVASPGGARLCTRTIRVTCILLRRCGHIPGAGHAVAKGLLLRAGGPAAWGVSMPRRETGNHVPSALGSPGGAAVERRSLRENGANNPGAVSRRRETPDLCVYPVPSHRMAMRRRLDVGHSPLYIWKM